MKKVQLALSIALVAVALLVVLLALRNPQPPQLPRDEDHAGWTGAAACDECHGPDAGAPRSKNHPVGKDCMRCHGRQQ